MLIKEHLTELSKYRPIFHSEADFQHSFAWLIHQHNPDCGVRLEYPALLDKRIYLDVLIQHQSFRIGIELKYKTKLFECNVNAEPYLLKNQAAEDIGRYDFLADIQRLEALVKKGDLTHAYAILLTNSSHYWRKSIRVTVDKDFRIHESRIIEPNSLLSWSANASDGTRKNRENDIQMQAQYKFQWQNYSEIEGYSKDNIFRYLLVDIT